MDVEAHRDLRLLEAVHEDSRVTQRGMAKKLGIALGLANIYLKRMIHKGYIKCVNVQPNRIWYLITPRGIAEKARLTYEFMDYSLHLYGEVRQHLREAMQDCAAAGKRVAIYGSGEAAELAYLSLKESGMEPVAIFDQDGGREFLGMPVLPIAEHASVEYDLMIVATLDRSGQQAADLQTGRRAARQTVPAAQGTGARAKARALHDSSFTLDQRQALAFLAPPRGAYSSRFMALTNKRIFVTGGAGFIGSHLVSQLVEHNEVVVFDNLHRNALQFAHLEGHKHLNFIKGDVLDFDAVRKAIDGCTVVIHCAAIAGVYTVDRSAVRTMEVNLLGTHQVVKAAIEAGRRALRGVLDERGLRLLHPQGQGRRLHADRSDRREPLGLRREQARVGAPVVRALPRRQPAAGHRAARSTSTGRGRSATARSAA